VKAIINNQEFCSMLSSQYVVVAVIFLLVKNTNALVSRPIISKRTTCGTHKLSPTLLNFPNVAREMQQRRSIKSSFSDDIFTDDSKLLVVVAPDSKIIQSTLFSMFLASAPLGMFLDNYHGLLGVLSYNGFSSFSLSYQGYTFLKSALWVPLLFGVAGLVMSCLIHQFDKYSGNSLKNNELPWAKVIDIITIFSIQYFLSGWMDNVAMPVPVIHVVLALYTLLGYLYFDTSASTLLLGVCTAVAGPLAELFLVNSLHLYVYNHADFFGICSWIPWVYMMGAPAVGNLFRRIYADTLASNSKQDA